MNVFKKLEQLHADFTITKAAYDAARHETEDMISATSERLQMERDLASSRAAELEQTANDLERSDTVRRVAAAELAKIKEQRIAATPEEMAAVAELIKQQQSAVSDFKRIQREIREAIAAAKGQIEAIRADVLGSWAVDMAPTNITSQEKAFAKLCEEAPLYDQTGI